VIEVCRGTLVTVDPGSAVAVEIGSVFDVVVTGSNPDTDVRG
jgi:hypothetical protein